MPTSLYIEKRKRTYYYIRHIPKKYQSIFRMKRVKYTLNTFDKKEAKKIASHLNSNFNTLLYTTDILLNNKDYFQLKVRFKGAKTMMQMILKGVNYNTRTIDSIQLDPDNFQTELALFKSFEEGFVSNTPVTIPTKNNFQVTLEQLIEIYSDEKVLTGQWPEKRRKEIGAIYNLFTRMHSKEIAADLVTNTMAAKFKAMLLKLPPNINSKANQSLYKGKTLDEIIAYGNKPMSITNANKYLDNLSYMFQWGEDHGHLTKNPFKRLTIKVKGKKTKVSKERDRFTDNDLININQAILNKCTLKPYMYWIPLMLLHTGARMNEIAQLYVKDIYQISDIWVISINEDEDDKRIKNVNSERIIPLHPKLIEFGLLEYIDKLKKSNQTRLFSEIKYRREGYGTTPSVWFAKIRGTLGLTNLTPKKDAHSYRHTFIDHLKQQGQDEKLVAAIVGHSSGGISFTRYGKDYKSNLLVKLINDVNFDSVLLNMPKYSDINH